MVKSDIVGSGDRDKGEIDFCLSLVTRSEIDRRDMRPEIGSGPNAYERGIACWRKAMFERSCSP